MLKRPLIFFAAVALLACSSPSDPTSSPSGQTQATSIPIVQPSTFPLKKAGVLTERSGLNTVFRNFDGTNIKYNFKGNDVSSIVAWKDFRDKAVVTRFDSQKRINYIHDMDSKTLALYTYTDKKVSIHLFDATPASINNVSKHLKTLEYDLETVNTKSFGTKQTSSIYRSAREKVSVVIDKVQELYESNKHYIEVLKTGANCGGPNVPGCIHVSQVEALYQTVQSGIGNEINPSPQPQKTRWADTFFEYIEKKLGINEKEDVQEVEGNLPPEIDSVEPEALNTPSLLSRVAREKNEEGVELSRADKHVDAIRLISSALDFAPSNEQIINNLSVAYSRQGSDQLEAGDYPAAITSYNKALEINADNTQAKKNLAVTYNNQGVDLAKQKRYAEARDSYKKATELDPSNSNAATNLFKIEDVINSGGTSQPSSSPTQAPSPSSSAGTSGKGAYFSCTYCDLYKDSVIEPNGSSMYSRCTNKEGYFANDPKVGRTSGTCYYYTFADGHKRLYVDGSF